VPATDQPKSRKRGSVAIILRIPPDLHAALDNEAVGRTKETGRGVSVQQVILEKLMGAK
jgi:predicted HicB family RNase H-like nuclease